MTDEKDKSILKSAKDLETFLNSKIYGRQKLTKAITLSLLNRENVLIQGKHGEAKSFLTHLISKHTNLNTYYKQIHNQTTLQDILGVINPIKFKNGELDLIKTKFWTANLMFFDECLRNSDLLDFLLEVMVEHKCSKTILGEIDLDELVSVIATTNPTTEEYHTEKMDMAMFDRFGFIVNVNHLIEDDIDSFKKVIRETNENSNEDNTKVDFDIEDLKKVGESIKKIQIPNEIYTLVDNFAINCFEQKVDFSTRLGQKVKKTIQTLAFYNEREAPNMEDFKETIQLIFESRLPKDIYNKLTEKLFNVEEFELNEKLTILITKYKNDDELEDKAILEFLKFYDKLSEKFLFFSESTKKKIEEAFKIINSELMSNTHSKSLQDKLKHIGLYVDYCELEELGEWIKSLDLRLETRYISSKDNQDLKNMVKKIGLNMNDIDTKNSLIKSEIKMLGITQKNLKAFNQLFGDMTKKNYLSRY